MRHRFNKKVFNLIQCSNFRDYLSCMAKSTCQYFTLREMETVSKPWQRQLFCTPFRAEIPISGPNHMNNSYDYWKINWTSNIGKHIVRSYLLNSYFPKMFRFLLCFLEVAIRNGQTNCSILLNSTWISELKSIILLYEICIYAKKSCGYHITSKR